MGGFWRSIARPNSTAATPKPPPPAPGAEGTFGDIAVCLARLNLHIDLQYQPNSRYCTFQTVEQFADLVASGLAVAASAWTLRRRIT